MENMPIIILSFAVSILAYQVYIIHKYLTECRTAILVQKSITATIMSRTLTPDQRVEIVDAVKVSAGRMAANNDF